MTDAPTATAAKIYLGGDDTSWTTDEIDAALAAETSAQARRVTVPSHVDATDPDNPVTVLDWTDDLVEALYRRVAVNLAMRAMPIATATGPDPEIKRLEGPYRKLVLG